ncbi:MAG TPA: histidinol-phosphate transaminase [Deltaproteobacteria bacterium]|nr:histidinol-phosphate transaminase [Deltaproteobacteria bacterium]
MITDTKDRLKLPVPDYIASLVPYPPGKPIEELERELGISGSIKLASNENPLGPSPRAIEAAARAVREAHRYPDGSCFYLKRRLAAHLGVETGNIMVGNGSNEIIELLVRTFVRPGDEVLMADPSFAVYPLVTQAAGGAAVRVGLREMTIDLDAMARALTGRTRLVFIANPNNPTGTIVTAAALDAFMERVPPGVVVCIDEAYYEYVRSPDYPDSLRYIKERAVVVLRTFSKIYGLAGLRVGYGAAPEEIVSLVERVRQPFNVNSVAQAAACAALDDRDFVERSRRANADGLQYLFAGLAELGLETVPTEANFFLIKVGDGKRLYEELLREGIIVRPMGGYGLGEYIRVNVGTKAENHRLLSFLKKRK